MAELNPGDPFVYLMGLYTTYSLYDEGTLAGYLFFNKGGFRFFIGSSNSRTPASGSLPWGRGSPAYWWFRL